VKEVDVTEVEDKFATQVGEVVGKYAQRDIPEGNAVEKAAVQDTTAIARTPAPTHFAVPPGLRAVDVMVDPTSAVAVQVGDRVDVLAAYRMDGHDVMCRTIAQNVEVLHFAGRYTFYYEPPADRKQQGQEAAPPEEKTILVLAVSPALSQEILAAQDRGALTVAVRRRGDHHYHRLAETWEHPRAPHRHYP
jgi:Flp pilus assembly protein CpaB